MPLLEYRVVHCSPQEGQWVRDLNNYATQGWRFRSFIEGRWDEVVMMLERDREV